MVLRPFPSFLYLLSEQSSSSREAQCRPKHCPYTADTMILFPASPFLITAPISRSSSPVQAPTQVQKARPSHVALRVQPPNCHYWRQPVVLRAIQTFAYPRKKPKRNANTT
eukprot:scaffold86523_cov31-Tisochrysis_lutea.AAC.2